MQLSLPVGMQEDAPADGSPDEDRLHTGPVPRICTDYFYLSNRGPGGKKGAKSMSTKELQKPLREIGEI